MVAILPAFTARASAGIKLTIRTEVRYRFHLTCTKFNTRSLTKLYIAVNMSLWARTGPVSGRCGPHQPRTALSGHVYRDSGVSFYFYIGLSVIKISLIRNVMRNTISCI